MTPINQTSIASIVLANKGAMKIFHRHGIDYCCKGKKTLTQYCIDGHLNEEEIVRELEAVPQTEDFTAKRWDEWSIDFLIEYIKNNHHIYSRRVIGEINGLIVKVAEKHSQRYPSLLEIRDAFNRLSLAFVDHLAREEAVVFSSIKKMTRSAERDDSSSPDELRSLQVSIAEMERDHLQAAEILDELALLSDHYSAPQDACTSHKLVLSMMSDFEKDIHQHAFMENHILFPRALALCNQILDTIQSRSLQ